MGRDSPDAQRVGIENVEKKSAAMMDSADDPNRAELRALLETEATIPARLVEKLMSSDDREQQADAYFCLSEHWDRIQPEMEIWFTMPFVFDFLFRCITDPNKSSDLASNTLSLHEAARRLLGILQSWNHRPNGGSIIADLVGRIERTFPSGGTAVRDCIETGFLEHALEHPELRRHFAHWSEHPEMREAHTRAMEWGRAHEQTEKRSPRNKR